MEDGKISDWSKKNFRSLTQMAKALLLFLASEERTNASEWVAKLQDVRDSDLRSDYMMYLLCNLQRGSLGQPFNRMPPAGQLRPLAQVLSPSLYGDITEQLSPARQWMEPQVLHEPCDNVFEPRLFPNKMPKPPRGLTAHCAVFSSPPN